jgi:hypothetical protein
MPDPRHPSPLPRVPEREPVVRIRCASPEDEARCRQTLERAGLAPEASLTWLVVRDADPDEVNRRLVAAGALGRVVVRESMGKLIGWLIDRQGALEGRTRNVKALVERVIADGGLVARYRPRPDPELHAAAAALHERLMAEGAPFLPWREFLALFCERREA